MFKPRQAEKGTVVEFADDRGSIVTLKADRRGQITPESDRDAAVLDSFGFAVDSATDDAQPVEPEQPVETQDGEE